MIADDQNSRNFGLVDLVAEPATFGCAGCYFDRFGSCWEAGRSPLCQPQARKDGRSIIWVARKPADNPATVAADILRAQGEDVDAASVKRAEAVCEEPVRKSVGIMPTEEWLATVCCGNFESCAKPCTPRGVQLQMAAEKKDAFSIIFDDPAYASLGRVLTRAYAQAATGKGAERHGQGQPFERQPMQDLIRLHGVGFATGQASKKSQEALRLPRARAVAELLGAINYLAGAVIAIEAGDTHHTD